MSRCPEGKLVIVPLMAAAGEGEGEEEEVLATKRMQAMTTTKTMRT
jgi:hypothetical protein